MSGNRPKLPMWPMLFAIVAIVLSIMLLIIVLPQINTDGALPYAIVGYVLTPFVAAGALIWARHLDLTLQGNRRYLRDDGQAMIKRIGLIVAISFLPAALHIWYIAGYVGSVIS
jgi:hypothetical protein